MALNRLLRSYDLIFIGFLNRFTTLPAAAKAAGTELISPVEEASMNGL